PAASGRKPALLLLFPSCSCFFPSHFMMLLRRCFVPVGATPSSLFLIVKHVQPHSRLVRSPNSRLLPPLAQQISTQQQILLLRCKDFQGDRTVVAGRRELLDVLRPVRRASRGGSQRQVLVRRAVVLRQVDVQ